MNKWTGDFDGMINNVERIVSERIGRERVTYVGHIYKSYVAYLLAMEEMEQRKRVKKP